MKTDQKKFAKKLGLISVLVGLLLTSICVNSRVNAEEESINTFFGGSLSIIEDIRKVADDALAEEIRKANIVYDNMTLEELSEKLEKSMNSSLKGKGKIFATYSIELGLDPYLALAITLHETGCSYSCSGLVQTHNNLGGLKGGDGRYMSFPTLDDGIKGYLNILYNRYYSKGLTTPELMNPVYAESTTWASRINWYIDQIKAK